MRGDVKGSTGSRLGSSQRSMGVNEISSQLLSTDLQLCSKPYTLLWGTVELASPL